jgi:bifunctional enzyme CysN/CysC
VPAHTRGTTTRWRVQRKTFQWGTSVHVGQPGHVDPSRSYILADTPGHERYTRNMFTSASNAHAAIMLVDARAGGASSPGRRERP